MVNRRRKMTFFSIEQIKEAFWDVFHESGELWFDYLGTPENNTEVTEGFWESFVESLMEE